MFVAYCPDCRRRMLLPLDHIDSMQRTADGFDIAFRCLHAHHASWSVRRPQSDAV